MKRTADKRTVRVYAYGVPAQARTLPAGWELVEQEQARQHDLWDALVDIDRAHERRTEEHARADDPAIGHHLERIARLGPQIGELIDARSRERQAARAKIDTPELDAQIKALVEERRTKRQALWTALAAWRKAHKETVRALELERRAAIKAARQASTCYWGNDARVLDDYDTARKTVRRKGRRLRYADRTRTQGVLHIAHAAFNAHLRRDGLTGLELRDLMNKQCGALVIGPIDPRAWEPRTPRSLRQRLARTTLTLRVDAAGNKLTLPLVLHRPLLPHARVKCAQLVWRNEGERWRIQLCLTTTLIGKLPQHAGTRACGIDLGWRKLDDGALLVATLASTVSSHVRRYTLPPDWMEGMDRVQRLSGYIDDRTLYLAHQLTQHESLQALPEPLRAPFARWRPGLGARHVDAAALHDAVRALDFDVPPPIRQWYDRYRHLLLYRDNLRVRLLRRRRELYRLAAREIALAHHTVTLEDMDLSAMARTKKRPDATDPELHAQARAQRQRACVHQLRSEIEHQVRKHGGELILVKGPSTLTCRQCATVNRPHDRAAQIWTCEGCGHIFDQDVNAAANLLAASTGERFGDAVLKQWEDNGLRARIKVN